jgi:hypothetical protein
MDHTTAAIRDRQQTLQRLPKAALARLAGLESGGSGEVAHGPVRPVLGAV